MTDNIIASLLIVKYKVLEEIDECPNQEPPVKNFLKCVTEVILGNSDS